MKRWRGCLGSALALGAGAVAALSSVQGASADLTAVRASLTGSTDLSTSSSTPSEIDPSLRVTVTVPPSGRLIVHQAAQIMSGNNAEDTAIYVSADGGSSWTMTQSGWPVGNSGPISYSGSAILTGLTAGTSVTLRMGWAAVAGGQTMTILRGQRGGTQGSAWQLVEAFADATTAATPTAAPTASPTATPTGTPTATPIPTAVPSSTPAAVVISGYSGDGLTAENLKFTALAVVGAFIAALFAFTVVRSLTK